MVKRLSRRNSRSKRNKSRGSKSLRKHIKSRGSKSLRGKNRRSKRMRTQRGGVIGDSTINSGELKPGAVLFLKDTGEIIVIISAESPQNEEGWWIMEIKYKIFNKNKTATNPRWSAVQSVKLGSQSQSLDEDIKEQFSKYLDSVNDGKQTRVTAETEILKLINLDRASLGLPHISNTDTTNIEEVLATYEDLYAHGVLNQMAMNEANYVESPVQPAATPPYTNYAEPSATTSGRPTPAYAPPVMPR